MNILNWIKEKGKKKNPKNQQPLPIAGIYKAKKDEPRDHLSLRID